MKVLEDYRWHDLSIMNDEDIDYEALPEEVLADLAFCGELYIATSSVLELSSRESKFVVPVTWKILSNSVGDQYLQSAALEALFDMDREKAVTYMMQTMPTFPPYVLNTAMNLLIMRRNELMNMFDSAATVITKRLSEIGEEAEYPKAEVRGRFFRSFKNAQAVP